MQLNPISTKRVMSGTWGQVWVNSELWAELTAFQAKYTFSKQDMPMAGQMVTDTKISSVKGTGSMTIHKVFTRLKAYGDKVMDGIDERMTLIGKLADPDAYGAERVAIYNVSLDENTLMDWKVGETVDITIPFTFVGHEWLDVVTP